MGINFNVRFNVARIVLDTFVTSVQDVIEA